MRNTIQKRHIISLALFSLVCLFVVVNLFSILRTDASTTSNISSGNWDATSTWYQYHVQALATTTTTASANYGAWDGTNFWIGNFGQHQIFKIDGNTLAVTTYTLASNIQPLQLAWDGRYIWVGSADLQANLVQFDPQSETVVNTYTLNPDSIGDGGVQGVVWDGTNIWAGVAQATGGPDSGLVLKIDPSDGEVLGTTTGQTNVNGMAVNGNYIWAACSGFVSKINRTDMTYSTSSTDATAYRVATDGTYMYVASFNGLGIYKFLASDGSLVAQFPSDDLLNAIAYDGTNIWVSSDDDYVTVQDPSTGQILAHTPNTSRSDLVFDGTNMWGNLPGVVTKLSLENIFATSSWPMASDDATISTGTVSLTQDENVNNLNISHGTLNLNGHTLTINGNLTLSGGSIDFANSSASAINLFGDWDKTNSLSSLLNDTGTVNLISTTTQAIVGANTFYDLTKTNGPSTLAFDSSATTTITHTLSLSGSLGNLLSIQPSGGGSALTSTGPIGNNNPTGYSSPIAIARASGSGDVYVADQGTKIIYSFNPDGSPSTTFDVSSAISQIQSLAVGADGTMYVLDQSDKKVHVFNPNGTASTTFNLNPNSPSDQALSIVVSKSGDIYVGEYDASSYISVFNPNGTASTTIDLGAGLYVYPLSIALASDDTLYMSDQANNNIQIFNPDHSASTTIDMNSSSLFPGAIAIDAANRLWIVDENSQDISTINPDGSPDTTINLPGYSLGIVFAPNGSFVSIDQASHDTVDFFTANGTETASNANLTPGAFSEPWGVTHDSSGNIFISDRGLDVIEEFDKNHNFVKFLDPQNLAALVGPEQMAVDGSDNLYIIDQGSRIVKFNSSGVYVSATPVSNFGANDVGGIAIDASGNIYLGDGGTNEVYKLDSNFNELTSVSSANGNFSAPDGLTIDPSGSAIWVMDFNHARIVELQTSDLSYITQHTLSSISVQLNNTPTAIAFNKFGSVFLATQSFSFSRVAILDKNFNWIANVVAPSGDFFDDEQLDVDNAGILYVPDLNHVRVASYQTVTPFKILSTGSASLSYLSVADSNNKSGFAFDCSNNCTDVGGNTNWTFVAASSTPSHHNTPPPVVVVPPPPATSTSTTPTATSTATTTQPVATTTQPTATTTTPVTVKPEEPPVVAQPEVPTPPVPAEPVVQAPTTIPTIVSNPVESALGGASNGSVAPVQTAPANSLVSNVVENIKQSYVQTAIVVAAAAQKVGIVVNTPTGSVVTKIISTTGVVAGAAVTISAVAFATPVTFSEIWLIPVRLLGLVTGALGIRRKQRPWGTVYDSVTKRPIDPAYVSLMDIATGKEVATAITDLDGRYSFLVIPGTYKIVAQKTNYVPSVKMAGKSFDEVYNDLYFGSEIVIQHEGEVITKNIPMDSLAFDWNEFTKNKMNINTFVKAKDITWARVSKVIFSIGAVVSLIALIFAPRPYNFIIAIFYVVAYVLNYFVFTVKKSGAIIEAATKLPLSFAIVKIFRDGETTPLLKKIADQYGNYEALVPKGNYSIQVDKKNDDGSYSTVYTSGMLNITKGIISEDVSV